MLRAKMTYQVVSRIPVRLVAKCLWGTAFLKNPAAQTTSLYGGRSSPGYERSLQLPGLCGHHRDTYTLDDHQRHLRKQVLQDMLQSKCCFPTPNSKKTAEWSGRDEASLTLWLARRCRVRGYKWRAQESSRGPDISDGLRNIVGYHL